MLEYACIAPHAPILVKEVAGSRYGDVAATASAFDKVAERLAGLGVETVVLISPHGPNLRNSFVVASSPQIHADLSRFRAPHVPFSGEVDSELTVALLREPQASGDSGWGRALDWGCSVPLLCLREGLKGVRFLLVGISALEPKDHFLFGETLERVVNSLGRRAAVICSADLSHAVTHDAPSGYSPQGAIFDRDYQKAVAAWDVEWILKQTYEGRREAAEDAVPQTSILMGALKNYTVHPTVLSYQAPFGVGYMVAEMEVAK